MILVIIIKKGSNNDNDKKIVNSTLKLVKSKCMKFKIQRLL